MKYILQWGALLPGPLLDGGFTPTPPIFPKVTFIIPPGCDALRGECVFQRLLLSSLGLPEWF